MGCSLCNSYIKQTFRLALRHLQLFKSYICQYWSCICILYIISLSYECLCWNTCKGTYRCRGFRSMGCYGWKRLLIYKSTSLTLRCYIINYKWNNKIFMVDYRFLFRFMHLLNLSICNSLIYLDCLWCSWCNSWLFCWHKKNYPCLDCLFLAYYYSIFHMGSWYVRCLLHWNNHWKRYRISRSNLPIWS